MQPLRPPLRDLMADAVLDLGAQLAIQMALTVAAAQAMAIVAAHLSTVRQPMVARTDVQAQNRLRWLEAPHKRQKAVQQLC